MEPVPPLGLPGEPLDDDDLAGDALRRFRVGLPGEPFEEDDLAGDVERLRMSSSRMIWRAMSDMGAIRTSDSPTCSIDGNLRAR